MFPATAARGSRKKTGSLKKKVSQNYHHIENINQEISKSINKQSYFRREEEEYDRKGGLILIL